MGGLSELGLGLAQMRSAFCSLDPPLHTGQRATTMVRFLQTRRSVLRSRLSGFETRSRRATLDLVSWRGWPRARLAFLMVDDNLYQCLQSEIKSHIIARKKKNKFLPKKKKKKKKKKS